MRSRAAAAAAAAATAPRRAGALHPPARPLGAGASASPEDAAAGRFTFPMSVAALPGGRICVADRRACHVRVYGPSGLLEVVSGSRGGLPGQFAHPAGLAALPGGRICVADCENHRVQVLALRGGRLEPELAFGTRTPARPSAAADLPAEPARPLHAPRGTFLFPLGVAALPHGRICVADTRNHRVQVLGPGGEFGLEIGAGAAPGGPGALRSPLAAAAGPHGRIYAVAGFHRTARGASGPGADAVRVFGPSGEFEFSFAPHGAGRGMVDSPAGIAVDSRGRAIVADTGNDRILAFDGAGRFAFEVEAPAAAGPFRSPTGVALRADGAVCVSEAYGSRVRVLGPRGGGTLLEFGAGGTGRAPGASDP